MHSAFDGRSQILTVVLTLYIEQGSDCSRSAHGTVREGKVKLLLDLGNPFVEQALEHVVGDEVFVGDGDEFPSRSSENPGQGKVLLSVRRQSAMFRRSDPESRAGIKGLHPQWP